MATDDYVHLKNEALNNSASCFSSTPYSDTEWNRKKSPVPIHVLNRHRSRERLEGDSGEDSVAINGLSKISFPLASYSVEESRYPGIPFQVARYLCETNPDILHRMAAALHNSGTVTMEKVNVQNSSSSSLLNMALATDALALQESVIDGRHILPAPPDVVAQIVNSVQQHNAKTHNDEPRVQVDANHRMFSTDETRSPVDELSGRRKELHPFPKELITTLVEKRSWFSAGGKEEVVTPSRKTSIGHCEQLGSNCSSHSTVERNRRKNSRSSNVDAQSVTSEADSFISEQYELNSNYSGRFGGSFSNMSVTSEMSGVEEEMFRIKKLLLESPSSASDVPHECGGMVVESLPQLSVLREKAILEGQLEALRSELERTTANCSELRAQLAASRVQLGTQTSLARTSRQEVDALHRMLGDVSRRLHDSEDFVVGLKEALEAKSVEAAQARSELLEAEAETRQARTLCQETKVEAESKEGAVQGLKKKVAELHVELQSASVARGQIERELTTLRNEVVSEQKMKEWYRKQVQELQSAKNEAQQEALALTTEVVDRTAAGDRLRLEADQLRQQLTELQQRAVREKEALLRHLETIEVDVREREAAYQQTQRERGSMDDVVLQRMRKIEADRARLAEESFSRMQLEHQLDVVRAELESRRETQARAETDVAEFAKQLVVLRKTSGERELEAGRLHEKCVQLEGRNGELESKLAARDEQLVALRSERSALEARASAMARERHEMDATLAEVRTNVAKLDGRIRQLRDESAEKNRAVGELQRLKSELEEDLRARDLLLEHARKHESRLDDELHALRSQLRQTEEEREAAAAAENNDARQLLAARATLDRVSGDLDRLVEENALLQKQVAERSDVVSKELEANKLAAAEELQLSRKLLAERSEEVAGLSGANELLTAEVRKLQATLEEVSARVKVEEVEEEDEDGDVVVVLPSNDVIIEQKLLEKEDMFSQLLVASKAMEVRLKFLEEENERLSSLAGRVRTEIGCQTVVGPSGEPSPLLPFSSYSSEFATQTEAWMELPVDHHRSFDVEILKELDAKSKSERRRYESNITLLTRKLKDALKARKKLELELKEAPSKEDVAVVVSPPLEKEDQVRSKEAAKINYYRKRNVMMEKKWEEMQRLYDEERRRADRNQDLLISVEREKGKLHALAESGTALKDQQSQLEIALSERENLAREISVLTKDATQRLHQEESEMSMHVRELEERLGQEQASNRELRKLVFREKCEAKGLRKNVADLRSVLEDTTRLLEAGKRHEVSLEDEVENQKRLVQQLQLDLSNVQQQLHLQATDVLTIRKEVEEYRAKDPLLADQLKTLGWHLHQKNQEISCLKDQGKTSEERHRMEVESASRTATDARKEVDQLKGELQSSTNEKFLLQTRVTEMRAALKASLERSKALQVELSKRTSPADVAERLKLPESPAPYNETLIASLLQQSLSLPESRPLSNLQLCLNTLKQEMAVLQQQLRNDPGNS